MPSLTCKDCKFWSKQAANAANLAAPSNVGICYGSPPSVVAAGGQLIPVRPNTVADDPACGSYQPKFLSTN